jgi:serine/threonine protein kinase
MTIMQSRRQSQELLMADDGLKRAGLILLLVVSPVFLILSLANPDFIALLVISLIVGLVLFLRGREKAQEEIRKLTTWRTVSPLRRRPSYQTASSTNGTFRYVSSVDLLNGRYQIEKQLKKGGMAIISLARDIRTGSYCVIKTPRYDTPHDITINIEKLTLEATVLRQFNHPNIVKYLDMFTHDDVLHLVVDYVEGDNLFDVFRRKPADESRVVQWGEQILDALEHIHRFGLIHRDVNPGNIMLKRDDKVVIIDFGTAKPVVSEGSTVVKTPGFEVPEQVATGYADERSDLFGVGGTLFYLLTSMPPGLIGNRNVAQLLLRKGVSNRTARCIAQALQMDANLRFQSAAAMRRALCGDEA